MTGVGGDTGRGLRVASRGFRTWWRLGWQVASVVVIAGLAAAVLETVSSTNSYEWHLLSVHTLCEIMLGLDFDPGKEKTIRGLDGTVYHETIGDIASFGPLLDLRARFLGDALDGAMLGGGIGAGVVVHRHLRAALPRPQPAAGPPPARRRAGHGRGAQAALPAVVADRAAVAPGAGGRALHRRRHPLAEEGRDPAHDRLGHHGLRQDRAHRGPRRADPCQGRALHRLRQDGLLYRDLLRPRPRRPSQPPGRPLAPLVALPRGPHGPRLRHDGARSHPAPEGRRRSLLDHRRAPALLARRRRALETRRDPQQGAGKPAAQDRSQRTGGGHGGHRGAVDRGSREPQDRALRARHAHRQHRRHGPAHRRGRRLLHPGNGSSTTAGAPCSSRRGATSTRACGA